MPLGSTQIHRGFRMRALAIVSVLLSVTVSVAAESARRWTPIPARPYLLRGADRRLLDRAERFLAEEQWDDAVAALMRLIESDNRNLVANGAGRFVSLNQHCQRLIAGLPTEPLQRYRDLVDRIAERWYREGVEQRELKSLRRVVDAYVCSSWGDDALLAIGEIELQRGNYQAARNAWRQIAECPAPDVSRATVQARLALVGIREGDWQRADEAVARLTEAFPNATGRLGGREVVYADHLQAMTEQARRWPDQRSSSDWRTFAGKNQRTNAVTDTQLAGSYRLEWSVPLANERLRVFPLVVGDLVVYRDATSVRALRLADGSEAFVARNELIGSAAETSRRFGEPHYSITATDRYLFGTKQIALGVSRQAKVASEPSVWWALDLDRDGAIAFQQPADEASISFAGAPLVVGTRLYVAMRSNAQTARVGVACYDLGTRAQVWQCWVCQANTPTTGASYDIATTLLTYDAGVLYANTNLGAVAALRADDGHVQWLTTYPRRTTLSPGDVNSYYRGPQPCAYRFGRVFVLPTDGYGMLALEAATGELLWKHAVSDPTAQLVRVDDRGVLLDDRGLRRLDCSSGKPIVAEPSAERGLLPAETEANFAYADTYVVVAERDRLSVFAYQQPSAEKANNSLTSSNE